MTLLHVTLSNMYKYLIITIALMFTAAGGYYIDQAGGGIMGNIIIGNITTQETLVPINPDDMLGVYTCHTTATCKNTYILILKEDRTFELTKKITTVTPEETNTANEIMRTNNDQDEEIPNDTEKGNWDIGVQNMLILTITGKGLDNYDVPQKIVAKNVTQKTLSRISYTKNNYKDMTNPIFIKQE